MKPSFKYFKNQKTNFGLSILKLETLLYQNIFKHFYNILCIYSDLDSIKKKFSGKHAIYKFVLNTYKLVKNIFCVYYFRNQFFLNIYKFVNISMNITKKNSRLN